VAHRRTAPRRAAAIPRRARAAAAPDCPSRRRTAPTGARPPSPAPDCPNRRRTALAGASRDVTRPAGWRGCAGGGRRLHPMTFSHFNRNAPFSGGDQPDTRGLWLDEWEVRAAIARPSCHSCSGWGRVRGKSGSRDQAARREACAPRALGRQAGRRRASGHSAVRREAGAPPSTRPSGGRRRAYTHSALRRECGASTRTRLSGGRAVCAGSPRADRRSRPPARTFPPTKPTAPPARGQPGAQGRPSGARGLLGVQARPSCYFFLVGGVVVGAGVGVGSVTSVALYSTRVPG